MVKKRGGELDVNQIIISRKVGMELKTLHMERESGRRTKNKWNERGGKEEKKGRRTKTTEKKENDCDGARYHYVGA